MDITESGVNVEGVEYFQESQTVRVQFDATMTSPSMAIIATVGDIMETDPVTLPPLHSIIDAEALDMLAQVRNRSNGDVHISFTYEGYDICVHSYGVISIVLPEDSPGAKNFERGS